MISKGNHVKFARFALLTVSEEAKPWLPSLLRWLRHRKNSWRQGLTKHKKVDEGKRSCLLFTWKRKNWENFKKRKSWHKLWKHTFYVEARKKEFVQCIIKQLLDSVFVITRIIKVSVRVISLSLPRPWFFWISQKPHPIIVYYYVFSNFGLITKWPL